MNKPVEGSKWVLNKNTPCSCKICRENKDAIFILHFTITTNNNPDSHVKMVPKNRDKSNYILQKWNKEFYNYFNPIEEDEEII